MSRPALFLDRDGIINVDHGYVVRQEDFDFIEGIFDVVLAANRAGYLVIVVTNQAGIGRGYYTEANFHQITDWMLEQFDLRGAHIEAVYFSPYHPEHGVGEYRRDSDCRKPAPGMLLRAAREHDIDLKHSILVGDKLSDIEAGQRAGVGTLLFYAGEDERMGAITVSRLSEVIRYLDTTWPRQNEFY